jgi:hypothetical protein
MSAGFDRFAKRTTEKATGKGLTRRQVVRGAAAGAAWTAPMIIASSRPAWAATTSSGGLGQTCGNKGQGTCNQPYHCNGNVNQCNSCYDPNICGGEGASCCPTAAAQCDVGLICAPQGSTPGYYFCRKPCATGCTTGQVCDSSTATPYCAKTCAVDSDCLGSAACAKLHPTDPSGYCTYQKDTTAVLCTTP